jgi:hypothetical protein
MIYENKVKSTKPQSVHSLTFMNLKEELLLNLTFKPDLTRTLKHNIVVKRHHNGKWGKSNLPNHPDCWSCCAAQEYESEVKMVLMKPNDRDVSRSTLIKENGIWFPTLHNFLYCKYKRKHLLIQVVIINHYASPKLS